MSDADASNAALMGRYYDEVFNKRNLKFLRGHLHPDVVGHGPGTDDVSRGIEQVVAFSAYVFQAYDEYRLCVDDILAEGDKVMVRATVTARHRGTASPACPYASSASPSTGWRTGGCASTGGPMTAWTCTTASWGAGGRRILLRLPRTGSLPGDAACLQRSLP